MSVQGKEKNIIFAVRYQINMKRVFPIGLISKYNSNDYEMHRNGTNQFFKL